MFCYMCDTFLTWESIRTTCPERGEDQAGGKTDAHTFSTLINFGIPKGDQHDSACAMSEAFDKFLVSFNSLTIEIYYT